MTSMTHRAHRNQDLCCGLPGTPAPVLAFQVREEEGEGVRPTGEEASTGIWDLVPLGTQFLQLSLEGGEGEREQHSYLGRRTPGKGYSKCKAPVAGLCALSMETPASWGLYEGRNRAVWSPWRP